MIVTANLQWLTPYLKAVAHIVPLDRIKTIKGYRVPLHHIENQEGALTRYKHKKKVTIALLTQMHKIKKAHIGELKIAVRHVDMVKDPVFQERILCTLAHELAHLIHWEHNRRRFELETRIYRVFGRVMLKLGHYKGEKK